MRPSQDEIRKPGDPLLWLIAGGHAPDPQDWPGILAAAALTGNVSLLAPWRDAPELPQAGAETIRAVFHRQTAATALRLSVAADSIKRLSEAGIPSRLLKGAATCQDVYEEQGTRPFGDIDLLVRGTDVATAAGLLTAAGFQRQNPAVENREMLADPHLLQHEANSPLQAHHHWPPLVSPEGVTLELHWTLGDGQTSLGGAPDRWWGPGTPLPIGTALDWPNRMWHALLVIHRRHSWAHVLPSIADLRALWAKAQPVDQVHLARRCQDPASREVIAAAVAGLITVGADWAVEIAECLALPTSPNDSRKPVPARQPSRWARRLALLSRPGHLGLFVRLGWCAWRHPVRFHSLSLPETLAALRLPNRWQGRVSQPDLLTYVAFWVSRRWIKRPSYCLQRAALLFAGLHAIGESPIIVFGLDEQAPALHGHAWVERAGKPFLEDPAVIERMVETYRFEA